MSVDGAAGLLPTVEGLGRGGSSSCFLLPFCLSAETDVEAGETESSRGVSTVGTVFGGVIVVRASFNSLGVERFNGIGVDGSFICLDFCRTGVCAGFEIAGPDGVVKYATSTSVKKLRDFESATMARHVSLLRSRVAAFPRMKREDFARVIATFIRRISEIEVRVTRQ